MLDMNLEMMELSERLFDGVSHFKRGEVIPHAMIAGLTGMVKDSDEWKWMIVRLKKMFLRQLNIVLWSSHKEGYKLLTHQEQLVFAPQKRTKKAIRQINKSIKETAALPDRELSDHQRNMKYNQLRAAAESRREVRSRQRTQEIFSKPTEGLPRRAM
jgi:hypothetical protein